MNSIEEIKFLTEFKGQSLVNFFSNFQIKFGSIKKDPNIKELFLSFIEKLMINGDLKLADSGCLLEGTIEQQIDLFRKAWPEKYDKNIPEYDIDNLWWLLYAPAGAVWIYEDGYEEWT